MRTLRYQIKCLQDTQCCGEEEKHIIGNSNEACRSSAVDNMGPDQYRNQIILLSEKHIAELSQLRTELEEKVKGSRLSSFSYVILIPSLYVRYR